ncbi:Protein cornichon 4 [Glycine soja]
MADLFAWFISFFLLISLLVLLLCLADLEFDYINPYDSSARINMVVLPEYITQAVLCCFYLLTKHWILALFFLPYLFHNVRLYRQGRHLVDVTEIFNLLTWEKKQRLVKLFYLVFTFFLSVFWGVNSRERLSFEGRLNQHPNAIHVHS